MKNHVFDGVDVLILIGLGAAGVSRRDHASTLGERLMKRHPAFFHGVNVGEAVQIKQRIAAAAFQNLNVAIVNVDDPADQWTASADCSRLMPGYSSVNCFKEAWRNAGATFSAKSFMLLRAK